MLPFKYLLAAAVVLRGLSQTSACSCFPPGTLCDSVLSAQIVLHVKAVSRLDGPDINDDAFYTLETIEVFKGEEPGPNEYDEVGGTFGMATGGNSALCGVFLELDGTEYLIDVTRRSDGTLYAAGICGLLRVWSEDDRATLEEGCDDYDPCNGECGEFQECVRSFDYYADYEDAYYCQDTCDPSPCLDGEACTLVYLPCSADPCEAEATCGEAEPTAPSPAFPPVETIAPDVIDPTLTSSYAETPTPSGDERGRPVDEDSRDDGENATPAPAPGTGGPPSSTPRTEAPTRDERGPPAQAPTLAPRGDVTKAPRSSGPPTADVDSKTSSPTSSDGSRGVSIPATTGAPSTASAPTGGDATPAPTGGDAASLPEISSAPTVSANAEGDANAAPAVVPGFVAASAVAVSAAAAAAASCASL